MRIVCLDLEGVLVPEIWIEFAERTGIPELRRTTRDEPDYDTLMKYRLDILAQKKLGLPDIQGVIASMGPMDQAGTTPTTTQASTSSSTGTRIQRTGSWGRRGQSVGGGPKNTSCPKRSE